MKITSVALPDDLTDKIDQVARDSERSRSFVIRKMLENSLTGADRLTALQAVADAGLQKYAQSHSRERAPNPGEIVAASATDGHARIAALNKIARGGK